MSIIRTRSTVPTPAERKAIALENIPSNVQSMATQAYRELTRTQNDSMDFLWNNRNGLTPQEIVDAMGTEAGKVLAMHGAITDLLIQVATMEGITPTIKVPTNNFTVHANGTVSILDEPYGS